LSRPLLVIFNGSHSCSICFVSSGLKSEHYYFRLFAFLTSWSFAIQQVFSGSSVVRVAVPGILFLINTGLTSVLRPYRGFNTNVMYVLLGLGGFAQVVVYLGTLRSHYLNILLFLSKLLFLRSSWFRNQF
jgi:hypothetical protein